MNPSLLGNEDAAVEDQPGGVATEERRVRVDTVVLEADLLDHPSPDGMLAHHEPRRRGVGHDLGPSDGVTGSGSESQPAVLADLDGQHGGVTELEYQVADGDGPSVWQP